MIGNPWFAAGPPPQGKRWAWRDRRFCLEDDPDAQDSGGSGGDRPHR
jgi:hypothetical protein